MKKLGNNKGQAMVEYIIIVVLIAITLIVLFAKFGGAIGKNVAGAANALDGEIDVKVEERDIKDFKEDGTFGK